MLGDINRNKLSVEYDIILCKPNREEIAILYEAYEITYKAKFPTTDELSFSIPYQIERQGVLENNPHFNMIKGDYQIRLKGTDGIDKYFIVLNPESISDSKKKEKKVTCYSAEYELNKKIIRGYDLISRKIYTPTAEVDAEGEYRGVTNYISTLTNWSFDDNSFLSKPHILDKHRAFKVSEKTVFDFLVNEVAQAYSVIFVFDTINKKIYCKEVDDYNGHNGLYISQDKYISKLTEKLDYDGIVTRLYGYGKDNKTINSVNPTGTPYLEDFSFYMNLDFMSQNLIDSLVNYQTLLTFHENNKTFENYLIELDKKQVDLIEKMEEIYDKETDIKKKETDIDSAIQLNQSLVALNNELIVLQNELLALQNEKQTIEDNMSNIRNNIFNFRDSIAKENNFTQDELIELDYFIKEKSFSSTEFELEQDLYNEMVDQLYKLAQPKLEFNIDALDFLKILDYQVDWNKLSLGDLVTIDFESFNIDLDVRLIGYTRKFDKDEKSLNLEFSNRESMDDPNLFIKELTKQSITSSTTLNMSQTKWDMSKDNHSMIKELIENDLDASKNKILAGGNQSTVIDDRGIWLVKKDSYGNVSPEQIRIINNVIALSRDGFKTATTAITPEGISAEILRGKSVVAQNGFFEGINVYDKAYNPIVEIGKYLDSNNEIQYGIRINGANLEITDTLPKGLDGFVREGELYNHVKISSQDGIQVLDNLGNERLKMGNYATNKYGILIKDASGTKTILDEDGLLQTYQEGQVDNVANGYPLDVNIYVEPNTKVIYKMLLRFKRLAHRAYSSTTMSGGGTTTTSSSTSIPQLTSSTSTTTNYSSTSGYYTDYLSQIAPNSSTNLDYVHNHGIATYDNTTDLWVRDYGGNGYWKRFVPSGAHTHGSHQHSFSVKIDGHSHTIPSSSHSHPVTIPEHSHSIAPGIFTSGGYANNIKIKINSNDVTNTLGGGTTGFTSDKDNLDITQYIRTGWNTISLSSTTLGRIDATVYFQGYVTAL